MKLCGIFCQSRDPTMRSSSDSVFKMYCPNSVNLTLKLCNHMNVILLVPAMVVSIELVLEEFLQFSDLTASAAAKEKFCYFLYDKSSPHTN